MSFLSLLILQYGIVPCKCLDVVIFLFCPLRQNQTFSTNKIKSRVSSTTVLAIRVCSMVQCHFESIRRLIASICCWSSTPCYFVSSLPLLSFCFLFLLLFGVAFWPNRKYFCPFFGHSYQLLRLFHPYTEPPLK